jgi:hypothetical protein
LRIFSCFGRRFAFVLCLFAVLAGSSLKSVSAQTKPNIISWGENVSSWNEQLGVTAMREGCSIVLTSCEPYLDSLANLSNVKTYYVSFPLNPSTSVSWAKAYSMLSLTHKMMVEIDFDDFVGRIEDDQIAGTMPNPATFVSAVIAATKSENPNLAFGVTIYEDRLTHAVLTNAVLPAALRAQIQFVHLYAHYREDAPNFAANVATAKTIFPNAKIIAGAYPYDRINYLPCAYKSTVECTAAQEQSLYKGLLRTQMNLLSEGAIYGVEFFFGYFGDPQNWAGWTTQTYACDASRLSQCYRNTEVLQNISLEVLQAQRSKGAPVVTLAHTSLYMGTEYVGKRSTPGKLVMTNTGSCPASLAAGASCTLTIYLQPTATGTRSGEIIIYDNAGAGNQTVTLTGTGWRIPRKTRDRRPQPGRTTRVSTLQTAGGAAPSWKCRQQSGFLVACDRNRPPHLVPPLQTEGRGPAWNRQAGLYNRTATLNDPDQNNDDSQDQQNMNEPSQGEGRDQSQKPQDQKDCR